MSDPAGADVYFKGYTEVDGPWQLVGRIPLKDVFIPLGQLRWRLVKDGFDAAEGASPNGPFISIRRAGEAPPGMVYVRGGSSRDGTTTLKLPDFWLDRYEVTNREYKRFVDAGGYQESKVLEGLLRFRRALPR